MNNLRLRLINANASNSFIKIDNGPVKIKKVKHSEKYIDYRTESNEVSILIYSYTGLNSKLWWLTELIYFLISIFGIFDVREKKPCNRIIYEAVIKLNSEETNIILKINKWQENQKAVNVEIQNELLSKAKVDEIQNNCYFDNNIKKRIKTLKILKVLHIVLIVFILGLIIVM